MGELERIASGGVRVLGRDVAHSPEPTAAGFRVSDEDFFDGVAQRDVGVAHDPGDLGLPRCCASLGDFGDELGLPHRPKVLGTALAVLGPTLEEHRAQHVVARSRVGV